MEKDFFLPFSSFTLSFLFLIMLLSAHGDASDFLDLFKIIYLFFYLFIISFSSTMLVLHCWVWLPQLWCIGSFIAAASLVLKPGLYGAWGSVVSVHRLGCSGACGISQTRESNLCPLLSQMDLLTTLPQEEPWLLDFIVYF